MEGSLAERHMNFVAEPLPFTKKDRTEVIGVVGLGYVGLPVSVALAERFETVIGFDTDPNRIMALRDARDWTNEIPDTALAASDLLLTGRVEDLAKCTMILVTVPTPITSSNSPDFGPLLSACRAIAPILQTGAIVVFESTVHPGATEEICGPELEARSGLMVGKDFHLAYSPERISPGDHQRGLKSVTKVVSAQSPEALERVSSIYEKVVDAGVHRAPSIKVAEAAKVFENTQRDVNIALMNELSEVCEGLGIRSADVIDATATKWNALPFTPGLVGGHCIGVDPHYLLACAEKLGLFPDVIRAARRKNEAVSKRIVDRAVKFLVTSDLTMRRARVGILGVTFKENVPDIRNSKTLDVVFGLRALGIDAMVCDPVASAKDLARENVQLSNMEAIGDLDLAVLAVPHRSFLAGGGRYLQTLVKPGGAIMDVRAALDTKDLRDDIQYWSL